MKKLLILLPVVIGGLLMSGCENQVAVVAPAPAPAVYYGDPYYVNGGVNYYYGGGRYWYWHGGSRFYVDGLPHGGMYFHGGHYYHHYYRHRWY